jgi:hypothetical protein
MARKSSTWPVRRPRKAKAATLNNPGPPGTPTPPFNPLPETGPQLVPTALVEGDVTSYMFQNPGSGGGIPDAPMNGQLYGRENGSWAIVPAGAPAPPVNPTPTYGIQNGIWVPLTILSDAPSDGNIYGRQNGGWVPVPVGANAINRVMIAGDSYGASSLKGYGDTSNSTGAPFAVGFKYVLGLPMYGRWTETFPWTNTTGADNYAIEGSILYGVNGIYPGSFEQALLSISDHNGTYPDGTIFYFEHTGINDTSEMVADYGGGMVTTADPLGTDWPAFEEPAINGEVTLAAPGGVIPAGLAAGQTPPQWVAINSSLYAVTTIAGSNVTLTRQNNTWATVGITPGETNPGGNMRWAAAQLTDDLMSMWLTSEDSVTNQIFAGGASYVMLNKCSAWYNNVPFVDTIIGPPTIQACSQTVAWWNEKLVAAVAALGNPNVKVFDLFTAIQNIWNNPLSYGIYDMDQPLFGSGNASPANDVAFADVIHPTATTHGAILIQLWQWFVTWVPLTAVTAPQIFLANQLLNSAGLVSDPPPWVAGTGTAAIWAPPAGNVLPIPIQSSDSRIYMANSIMRSHTIVSQVDEFDNIPAPVDFSGSPLPDETWSIVKSGTGQGFAAPGADYVAYGGTGLVGFNIYAAGDSYGIIKSSVPILSAEAINPNGYIHIVWSLQWITVGTDTQSARAGLVDALSNTGRPDNGIFLEFTDTNGVITGAVVYASAGAYTVSNFAVPALSVGRFNTFELISDYTQRRWFLYYSVTEYDTNNSIPPTLLPLSNPSTVSPVVYALMPALPSGPMLCKAVQIQKVAGSDTGVADQLFTDTFNAKIRGARI